MSEEKRKHVNARLHQLAAAHGGELTVDLVIEEAKNPESPLHDHFEWNLEKAARRHWESVANRLINGYKVTVTVENRTLSAPVFVRSPESPKRFIHTERVMDERSVALAALKREADRVQAAIKRMQGVAASLGLADRLDALDASLKDVLEAIA